MADPTKEEQARAKAAAEASAAAPNAPKPAAPAAPAPAPARHDFAATAAPAAPTLTPTEVTPTLVETLKNLEARSRPAGYASATEGLDEAPEGGRFRVRGVLVNAHGRELNEDGSLKHPEQQQVDVYGRLT